MCIACIYEQVGDAGPILDAMAVMLENISSITVIARTTIGAVFRTAQIVASIPNLSYQNKVNYIRQVLSLWILYIYWLDNKPISFNVLGISRVAISSVNSCHESSRLWNTNWSSPHLFSCPCSFFSSPFQGFS